MRIAIATALILAAGAAGAAEIEVGMKDGQYAPEEIRAKLGDTLVFTNDDSEPHAVYVPTNGFGIHFGGQKPGEVRKLPLKQEGNFEVECVVHPGMLTKVMVTR
jgi:plastocyanin